MGRVGAIVGHYVHRTSNVQRTCICATTTNVTAVVEVGKVLCGREPNLGFERHMVECSFVSVNETAVHCLTTIAA